MTWIFFTAGEPQHKRKANPLRRAVLHRDKRITRIFLLQFFLWGEKWENEKFLFLYKRSALRCVLDKEKKRIT